MSNECKGVWILAEQSAGRVQRISHELLTRGRELADKRKTELVALILGNKLDAADLAELIERGADRVLAVEAKELEHFLPEPYANCMLWVIANHRPEIIIAGATSTGRTLMPYVAVRANAGLTADCTILDIEAETGNLLQTRPAIGGNILATIKTPNHRPQMATVRPHVFKMSVPDPQRSGTTLVEALKLLPAATRIIRSVPSASAVNIAEAEVVVAGGRGLKKAENLAYLWKLAELLGGVVGVSRACVDAGWISAAHQVGQTGKTVAPKVYLAFGISGAIQHLEGMRSADTIIAVNNDPNAPIFDIADLGIVGDLLEILPLLIETLDGKTKTT